MLVWIAWIVMFYRLVNGQVIVRVMPLIWGRMVRYVIIHMRVMIVQVTITIVARSVVMVPVRVSRMMNSNV